MAAARRVMVLAAVVVMTMTILSGTVNVTPACCGCGSAWAMGRRKKPTAMGMWNGAVWTSV
jgi:hypothetical protein